MFIWFRRYIDKLGRMSRPDSTPAVLPLLRRRSDLRALARSNGTLANWTRNPGAFPSTPLLTAAILLLSGCESVKPLLTRSETVEVRIPIPVSCVSVADVPAVPPTAIPLEGDIKQLAAGAAADVLALEQYAMRANALLTGCAR